ncbi:MAG: C-type lectin domain-containing protein [Kofleriaceae bacterium]
MRRAAILTSLVLGPACSFPSAGGSGGGTDGAPTPGADGGLGADAAPGEDVDAGAVPGFDPVVDCPATYDDTVFAGSRYRYTSPGPGAVFDKHRDECDADAPGLTHLAIPDGPAELAHLVEELKEMPRGWAWSYVGITYDDGAWVDVLGEEATFLPWSPGEPNDSLSSERAVLVAPNSEALRDVPKTWYLAAVCECDGRPGPP